MSRLARLFIALILAVSVPAQAISAVTAGMCMALGHHDSGHAQPHQHDGAAHEHESSDSHAVDSHCAPCAGCCAAAAISSFASLVNPEPPIASVMSRSTASFTGVQPDLLDRPPLAL